MSGDSGAKWTCPDCKRGFKREVFYIKHRSRASCISERDSILVNYSQTSSQTTSPRSSVVQPLQVSPSLSVIVRDPSTIHNEYKQLIDWFDSQILQLRNSFIHQLNLLHENATTTTEEEVKSTGELSE